MNVEFAWDKEKFKDMVSACRHNPITSYIEAHLPKNSPMLEAGCGMGHFVEYFSGLGYDIYGIEVGKEAVEAAKTINANLKIQQASVEDLPFPDNFFGGVMCLGVVEHITQGPDRALKEIYRVMKPGATATISVPVLNSLRKIKYYLGISFMEYYLRRIYYRLLKKDVSWLKTGINKNQLLSYHRWPSQGDFFEYRFSKKQFSGKLRQAGFLISAEIPLEGLGGLYHELGGVFINLSRPNFFVRWLDKIFSKIPFFHHHTYLAIVKKPL